VIVRGVFRIRAIDVLDRLLQRHELLDNLLKILVRVFVFGSRQVPSLRVDAVVDHQAPQRASLGGGVVDELDVFQTGEKQLLVDGGDDLVDHEIGGDEVQQAVGQGVQLNQVVVALDVALHPGIRHDRVPADAVEVGREGVWELLNEIDWLRPGLAQVEPSGRTDGREEIGTAHQQLAWYCEDLLVRGVAHDNVESVDGVCGGHVGGGRRVVEWLGGCRSEQKG
jgi:hypothetical protein